MKSALISAEAYGRRVGIQVSLDNLEDVRRFLPHWWRDSELTPEMVWIVPNLAAAESVVSELELWMAEHARGAVFIHAGVVAIGGQAVVLPGRSMTGKTTLVSALLDAGADYLSDEYAVLDDTGLVYPYSRNLSIRLKDGTRRSVTPSDLGCRVISEPVSVRVVACIEYATNGKWAMTVTPSSAAILRVLDNCVCARSRPEQSLRAISQIVERAICLGGVRGEAVEAAQNLRCIIANGG